PVSDDGTPAASRHSGHRRGGHLPLLRKPRPRRFCVVRRRPPHGVRLPSVPSAGLGRRLLVRVPHVLARYTSTMRSLVRVSLLFVSVIAASGSTTTQNSAPPPAAVPAVGPSSVPFWTGMDGAPAFARAMDARLTNARRR